MGLLYRGEVSEQDRRKLARDARQSRTTSLSPRRVTSSSDAMDTDEVTRHTRSILTRMRTQSLSPVGKGPIKAFPMSTVKKEETENDDESTMVESDLNMTVIPKEPNEYPQHWTKKLGLPTHSWQEILRKKPFPEYTHGDLFLPIPGAPSINDLEPEETLQLTTHGNRVKIVTIKLWGPKYQTDRFMIDDLTGKIYAVREGGINVIKEQAFLD